MGETDLRSSFFLLSSFLSIFKLLNFDRPNRRNAAARRWKKVSNAANIFQSWCFLYCYHLGRVATALQSWDDQDTAARNQMGRTEVTWGTTIFHCVSDARYTTLCFFQIICSVSVVWTVMESDNTLRSKALLRQYERWATACLYSDSPYHW